MTAHKTGSPPITREEFAQNLADSGVSGAGDLSIDLGETNDGAAAASNLVISGKLTRFQADAILERRFGDLRMGNYEILDRLGAGGMGTVYKARHRRMKRIVALKVLSKEVAASEKFAHRFQREVETIARLSHPNIVMAYDADEGEAGPFLVMEFVNGRDLTSEVASGGRMSVADAIDRIVQAGRGLEYAHSQGIIHRDIKPGNLLRDVDGVVKVADLGLARLNESSPAQSQQSSLTQAGTVVGTVDYMSPEQAVDSGTVDHRADIYSLGCTLYYLLTGHAIFSATSILAIMLKHRDAPIPSLQSERPDVPAELESIFRRMVAKQPADRYPTMGEVVRELEKVQSRLNMGGPEASTQALPAAPAAAPGQTVAIDSPLAAAFGDTFQVGALPASPADPVAAARQRVAGLTVVVAEPSRTQAGIIRSFLQQLQAGAVHPAESGLQVIETAKRTGAHVVVSSMHLADMTGLQLVETLRADPACAGIGFVLATSGTDSELTARIPRDPRTTVMPKPFDLARLAQAIAAVVA
jgi:CheY-like chemotaxis protein